VKFRHLVTAAIASIGAWVLPLGTAQADSVLYDSTGYLQGQQSFVESFNIATPGTLTVSLANIPWLDTIAGLSFFVSSPSSLIGSTMGAGSQTMNVAPGTIYAHWFGDANGAYGLGVFSVNISFVPNASVVPLPASLLLLLSGLGILFGWQRSAKSPTDTEPSGQGTAA
jgi:hypothetical protein